MTQDKELFSKHVDHIPKEAMDSKRFSSNGITPLWKGYMFRDPMKNRAPMPPVHDALRHLLNHQ